MKIRLPIIMLPLALFFRQYSSAQNLQKNRGNNYLWGVVDVQNNVKIPAMYDIANGFNDGKAGKSMYDKAKNY